MRSKFTPESWARLQNHLYRSPLATPSPSCSNTPAHMETSKLQPLGPILCLPTPPPPLKENKSWSPAPSLQNSGSHVGWVCSCYRFLHIKKKKKKVMCKVKMTRAVFPPLLQSPQGYSSRLWLWRQKGQLTFLTTWGSSFQPPLPHLPPMAWLKAWLALRKGNSMSAPIQRRGSCFQRKRQNRAASQEKEKTRCCPRNPTF